MNQKVSAENILFAIEYPYEDSGPATEFMADAALDEKERALINQRNAERLFHVPFPR